MSVANRQPHPHPGGNRDHRPDNALTTAAANPGRDRGRDAHASLAGKLDLNRRRRRTPSAIPYRGDQHLGETVADPDLPPPAIDLAGANLRPPSDFGDHRSRRQALGNNRSLLLGAPPTPSFRPGDDFKSRHRTVSGTCANTVACTSAYQPDNTLAMQGGHHRTVTDQVRARRVRIVSGQSLPRGSSGDRHLPEELVLKALWLRQYV